MKRTPFVLLGLALAGSSTAVLAHVGGDAAAHHGFASGFMHPFTGLDHLAAMLGVGVWSALTTQTWKDRLRAPLAFASVLLFGALLAAAGVVLPAVEPLIAASLLVLGLLVALQRALPPVAATLLVGGFALFHGAAHGQELQGAGALAGMVLATALLHALGLGLGQLLRTRAAGWSRAAGLATGLFGATLLLA